jgi:hypothetical protein
MKSIATALVCLIAVETQTAVAWGLRGHTVANLAAVEAIGEGGPVFLRQAKAYIGHLGTVPDLWRGMSEPFLRISEDPNHGWYTESFDFIKEIPRSRTEFTLRVYDEYLRVSKSDPERAKFLNIRYTGVQAYSMMEGYERMKAGMRLYRAAAAKGLPAQRDIAALYASVSPLLKDASEVQKMFAADVAFYMGWLGHYIADSDMPLHNSKHHDGWAGDNPHNYTRDPEIHGRFESQYVDAIRVTEDDLKPYIPAAPRRFEDPWTAILDHMIEARAFVEEVYRLDQRKAFDNPQDRAAREFTYKRLASGAAFLRDLAYTAWLESAVPPRAYTPLENMSNPDNPRYNPAAGSAPAPARAKQ